MARVFHERGASSATSTGPQHDRPQLEEDWRSLGALFPGWRIAALNYIIGEMIAELSTSHTYVGAAIQPSSRM